MDCVRLGAAFLDEMLGWEDSDVLRLPQDAAVHDGPVTARAVRRLLDWYGPATRVEDHEVEPGDFVVVGTEGRMSHLMIVDSKPNIMWHAMPPSVAWTGIGTPLPIVAIYRVERKLERWLSRS